MSNDSFANPQPPSNYNHSQHRDDSGHLTNDDFRKLLMTPSVHSIRERAPQTVRADSVSSNKKKFSYEAAEKRKERKLYYAALVKESQEKQNELAQKYRDRAKERREREKTDDTDYTSETTTANYTAVAPGFSLTDNAERRRQLIEESKYLGGDLEHTHLVKGLDYALLQKIRAEQEKKAQEGDEDIDEDEGEEESLNESMRRLNEMNEEDEEDKSDNEDESVEDKIRLNLKPKILTKTDSATLASMLNKSMTDTPYAFKKYLESSNANNLQKNKKSIEEDLNELKNTDDGKLIFKTKVGRNVYRVLFETVHPKTNDLFLPNRMAYIVDLNDEETDVPITSIRSKAECQNNETNSILTTNDIVINKLTQILSYLRHGKREKKLKKKLNKPEEGITEQKKIDPKTSSLGIYDDIDDYIPDLTKKLDTKKDNKDKAKNYFGEKEKEEILVQGPTKETAIEFIKNINEKYANKEIEPKKEEKKATGMSVKFEPDSYAECYPGTNAEEDVNIDSDEEADFSKMDPGTKKGPVNRWDFETNEEYGSYMSNKEALPKAAFQFGVKMNDGRKTRRMQGDNKQDKAKLDKEWTQISKLIEKRKSGDVGGDFKKPKY